MAPAPVILEFVFKDKVPTIDIVVDNLIVISGLLVEYDSESGGDNSTIWTIKSLLTPMKLILVEAGDRLSYTIAYDPLNKWAPYLAGTLQFVLVKQGGFCDEQLPDWAGKRWAVVKKNWKSHYFK